MNEHVRVVEPFIDGNFYAKLEASLFNGSHQTIKNIRLVAIFYGEKSNTYPTHYILIKLVDAIPPGLAKRFIKEDSFLRGHGRRVGLHGKWTVKFRVLDYDIVSTPMGSEAIPTFQ